MNLFIIFIGTMAASYVLTRFAMKLNVVDEPNYRKVHRNPTPKAGGIGFIIPTLIAIIWYVIKLYGLNGSKENNVIILLTLFLFITGIVDDKLDLNAKRKLLIQLLAAVITVSAGIYFHLCSNYYINYFISVVWIIGFINAMNLVDGLDGLAGGVGLISSAGILYFANLYSESTTVITTIALIGSLSGFLFWNRHPAKIFMGDTGSLPLGYLLASLIINTGNSIGGFGGAAIAFFIVAIPVYDTILSVTRRKLNKRPIFSPDRSHFYNLLMDQKGFSHKNTVNLIYFFNICLVIAAMILNYTLPIYRYILAALLVILAALGSVTAGFLKVDDR